MTDPVSVPIDWWEVFGEDVFDNAESSGFLGKHVEDGYALAWALDRLVALGALQVEMHYAEGDQALPRDLRGPYYVRRLVTPWRLTETTND